MWYDVLVVGVLLFAVIRGAMKGIVWQLATIAALVLCFAFSESLSLAIAPLIAVKPPLNRWLAMFGLYLFFSFLSFGAARGLRKWIEQAQFVEYDRHLGSMFGFVKGVLFVLVMTFFGVTLTQRMPETQAAIFHSHTGKVAAVIMDRLHPVMPKELHDVLEPYIHSLDRPGLDLKHAHHDHDHDQDHHAHDHDHHDHHHSDRDPLEPPPFPESPRRGADDPPPFDDVTDREPERRDDWGLSDFFGPNSPLPGLRDLPGLPDLSTKNSIRPTNGTQDELSPQRTERENLLREMAGVLAEDSSARQAIIEEVENSLAGLPDQIKLQVVKDWYTDLLIYDQSADPDPETDLSTPFDQRILRQLQQNEVPLRSLNSALQERLKKILR